VFRLFRCQPLIRLNLAAVQPEPRRVRAQPVLLRSAVQAEENCAEIAYARRRREEHEAQLKDIVETERLLRW
jgi:hypothetical protein